jgi:hypothetical protein
MAWCLVKHRDNFTFTLNVLLDDEAVTKMRIRSNCSVINGFIVYNMKESKLIQSQYTIFGVSKCSSRSLSEMSGTLTAKNMHD